MAKARKVTEKKAFIPVELILETQEEINLLLHLLKITQPTFNMRSAMSTLVALRTECSNKNPSRWNLYAALHPWLTEGLPK